MTHSPATPLRLSCRHVEDTLRVELRGDLDRRYADLLVEAVSGALSDHRRPRTVRLDCTGLTTVDPSGLSALLMVRRRTDEAGAVLHLVGRPPQLERLLELTGTLSHLTARPGTRAPQAGPTEDPARGHAAHRPER
ncbi:MULTISPECIES: STAS domain-containing protein [Streptomyces]|uniref:STAS domain-containing protein n=1 Tax=Streptomyces virginiae TaxID=1961 RepID=A0ABZ1TNW0_STRVG|nr:STAS domain-containing protein [Streptomyces virginiae]WTB26715.1 STAS domain-containing protein [Streptomyces virginiae]